MEMELKTLCGPPMDRSEICEDCFQALKLRNGRICAVANLFTAEGKPCFGFCKGIELPEPKTE